MAQQRTGRQGRIGNGPVEDLYDQGRELILGKKSKAEMARDVAAGFHGRGVRGEYDVVEIDKYPSNLAEMGILLDLAVIVPGSDDEVVPVVFSEQDYPTMNANCNVKVCATPDRRQIIFSGGDQELDVQEVLVELGYSHDEIEALTQRYKVVLGEVYSIGYFTDKHHLTGPKEQKRGTPYEHKFGEQGGERPMLVYDTVNKRVELVGGGYEIRDEGIWN